MTEAERQTKAYAEVKARLFGKQKSVNIAAIKEKPSKSYAERRAEGRLLILKEKAERAQKLALAIQGAAQRREEAERQREMIASLPLWRRQETHFDAHVEAFLLKGGNPYRHLHRRCIELRVKFEDIVGPSRSRELVAQRHALMYEVWALFDMSLPRLGRLFGDRDHTTVLHAIKKMQRRLGASQ